MCGYDLYVGHVLLGIKYLTVMPRSAITGEGERMISDVIQKHIHVHVSSEKGVTQSKSVSRTPSIGTHAKAASKEIAQSIPLESFVFTHLSSFLVT